MKFMERIGCYALTESTYSFSKGTFNNIVIETSNNNFHAVYNSVFTILNRKGYDFIVEEKRFRHIGKSFRNIKQGVDGVIMSFKVSQCIRNLISRSF